MMEQIKLFWLIKNYNRENLFRIIVETIRNTLDINEVKKEIVNIVGSALKADRCFLTDFDKTIDRFAPIKYEYLSSDKISSCIGQDVHKLAPDFIQALKEGKYLLIKNREIFLDSNEQIFDIEQKTLEKYDVNSLFAIPLFYQKELLGVLSVNYTKKNKILHKFEIELMKDIADQIAISLYQANLYNITKKQKEREQSLGRIINIIRSSLDIKKIKDNFVTEVGKYFNVNRCFIYEYGSNIKSGIYSEYTSSPDIKRMSEDDFKKPQYKFWEEAMFKTNLTKGIFAYDLNKFIIDNNLQNTPVNEHMKEYNIKTAIGIPILYANQLFGELIIQYTDKIITITDDDKNFLYSLANQAGIALYQAELYAKEKETAQKEITLRETIKILRSTLDTTKIKRDFIEIACNYFNADRCLFNDYDKETCRFSPFEIEKLKSTEIKSLIGFDVEKDFPEFAQKLKHKKRNIIIKDLAKTLSRKKLPHYKSIETLRKSDAKSDYGLIVQYKDEIMGILILHYVNEKKVFSSEELDFLKVLRDQVGIALYQAELYKKTQLQLEREKIIAKITSNAMSTFDINQISPILKDIGIITKADRCYFALSDLEKRSGKIIDFDGEYLSSPDVKSIIGYNFPKEDVDEFIKKVVDTDKIDIVFYDFEKIKKENRPEYAGIIRYSELFDVKNSIGMPVFYNNKFEALLGIEYTKKKVLPSIDEQKFLRILHNHIMMVFNQIQNYKIVKKTAERESLMKNIIEIIRSSLNIEETLAYICEETAKLFNVERSAIAIFPNPENFEEFEIRKEYKATPNIKGFTDIPLYSRIASIWGEILIKNQEVMAIDNILESDTPDYFKNEYNSIGVKSIIGTPIKKGDDVWGSLVLTDYNKYRHWSEEEKILIKTIASQTYIAINQAELYEKQKLAAERERISRNIIEILRSSIDKTIIIKLFVKNIGKFFDANRVLFSEYDSVENKYLPANENSEYLSDCNEKSLVGFDWTKPEVSEYILPLLEKRELNIFNLDEYIKQNQKNPGFINFFESYNIKSSYNFPVMYHHDIMGFFCLDYIDKPKILSQEDIGRIRSICTQAGIALYHASLYLKAQQCILSRETFKTEFIEKIIEPTHNILDISLLLTQNDFGHSTEIDYLNKIINSCNQLLELTKYNN